MVNASTAEDLHYTHANDMVEDKAEVIRRIASGERVYQKVHMIEREVSPQPGFVIVYGKVLMEVSRAAGLLVTSWNTPRSIGTTIRACSPGRRPSPTRPDRKPCRRRHPRAAEQAGVQPAEIGKTGWEHVRQGLADRRRASCVA